MGPLAPPHLDSQLAASNSDAGIGDNSQTNRRLLRAKGDVLKARKWQGGGHAGSNHRIDVSVGAPKIDHLPCDRWRGKNGADREHLGNSSHHVVIKVVKESGFILRCPVRLRQRRTVRARGVRLKLPGQLLSLQIDGPTLSLVRPYVERTTGDGRRGEHGPALEVQGVDRLAGFGVERVEQAGV